MKLSTVDLVDFPTEILGAKEKVLLAFLLAPPSLEEVESFLRIERESGSRFKVCLAEGAHREALMRRLEVKGTPAFLLFHRGVEVRRLHGRVEADELALFLSLGTQLGRTNAGKSTSPREAEGRSGRGGRKDRSPEGGG